jgi:hypothetical protein
MKLRLAGSALLSAALACSLSIPSVMAQAKKAEKKAESTVNVQGMVQSINKDTSTIMIQASGSGPARPVVYDAKTKFLYGHSNDSKPGNVAALKDTYYISCAGSVGNQGQLMATDCIYREAR